MLGRTDTQANMFREPLAAMLNQNKPLLALGREINWAFFESHFSKYYSKIGRPSKPIRLMVSLLIIKQLENISDERLVEMWEENPYWQAFSGEQYFQSSPPCEASELCHFRDRIGSDGVELIFSESIRIHGDSVKTEEVLVDTTCQEKDITFPTDSKLLCQVNKYLRELANDLRIPLRQSYVRVEAELLKKIRFTRHKAAEKQRWIKKLRTNSGRLFRDVSRKLPETISAAQSIQLDNCQKIIDQKKESKNKIYSLYEPQVACIAKGKMHKRYEYGAKAAIATCFDSGVIVGAVSFPSNAYDPSTQPALLDHIYSSTQKRPRIAIGDRIYSKVKDYKGTKTIAPTNGKKHSEQSRYQRELYKKRFRKRAGIEAVISHLKQDFRLGRNYLSGIKGDEINLLMASAAFNFKKWMNTFWAFIFIGFFSVGSLKNGNKSKAQLFLRLKLTF